ncbi:MAG: hypothetical protein V3W43_16605 [Desulfatiglandaceae bacterium]
MEIEVRLFANLRESHIPEGKINLEDRTTVGELLEKIELSPPQRAQWYSSMGDMSGLSSI